MNTTLLYRLAWKELRTLRPLWLSLLGMGLVLHAGGVWFMDQHTYERAPYLFGVALWLPAVYSLACAAMAFAGEREEGTDQFLSRMAAHHLCYWA